jgi:hypothetical protein
MQQKKPKVTLNKTVELVGPGGRCIMRAEDADEFLLKPGWSVVGAKKEKLPEQDDVTKEVINERAKLTGPVVPDKEFVLKMNGQELKGTIEELDLDVTFPRYARLNKKRELVNKALESYR